MCYLHFACGGTPSMRKGSFETKVRILLRGLSRNFSKKRGGKSIILWKTNERQFFERRKTAVCGGGGVSERKPHLLGSLNLPLANTLWQMHTRITFMSGKAGTLPFSVSRSHTQTNTHTWFLSQGPNHAAS